MIPATLKIVCEDASILAAEDQVAFAMMRRQGFGASDSSILLGVNPFPDGTIEKLIAQKVSKTITVEELAIGEMVNVRKGNDLEPLILKKFTDKYGKEVHKPKPMYRIGDTPLTVNFDGLMAIGGTYVPVECKFVSTYAVKHWDTGKALGDELTFGGTTAIPYFTGVIENYIEDCARACGIPIYYYTQLQQQLLALDAPVGYLTALFDKDWQLRTFVIPSNRVIQDYLLEQARAVWARVEALR